MSSISGNGTANGFNIEFSFLKSTQKLCPPRKPITIGKLQGEIDLSIIPASNISSTASSTRGPSLLQGPIAGFLFLFPVISLTLPDTAVLGGSFISSSTTIVITSSGWHPNGVLSAFTTSTVGLNTIRSLAIPFISRGVPSACVISMSASGNPFFCFTLLYSFFSQQGNRRSCVYQSFHCPTPYFLASAKKISWLSFSWVPTFGSSQP
ncbi:unnamed protein product [Acanthosepion pharaonis]|uniref:Uncharacterized protein n=1 Tax=Acanthosepion pharaonis TaxID=158019 RepID=A0A812DZ20_ACAPH|nr:unnamed protein product [Sepia pharaonis]